MGGAQPEKNMQRQTSPAEFVQSTASTMQRQTSVESKASTSSRITTASTMQRQTSVQSKASTSSRKREVVPPRINSPVVQNARICFSCGLSLFLDLHVDEDAVDEPKPQVMTESYSGPE